MRNIKITYMYDGTDFFGFQKQPGTRTVQGELEKALSKIMCHEVILVSSGRTDRGVHANMQVSNFLTDNPIPVEKLLKALNNMLPLDISVENIEIAASEFSSRYSAKERVYRYYLTTKRTPFSNRFATYIQFDVELNEFLKIMSVLVGQHDFKNFRLSDCTSKHQVREIFSITGESISQNLFFVEIRGNAFLKSQIRIIVGTALEIYLNKRNSDYFQLMLKDFSKEYQKVVAPPNGLTLYKIIY